jgi:2-haloacid dehalogenase
VLHRSLERSCRRWGVAFDPADAQAIVEAVPTWGPHADLPAALAKVAEVLPLVILSNAADSQIRSNVDKLGAPFHAVLTAEQAKAYKPRFQAFEYMFDALGCGPEHFMHVSSSLRYDLMSAHDLRIGRRVFVDRGHGPGNPAYAYQTIADLGGLPGLLGPHGRRAMSCAPVTERRLPRTTFSVIAERIRDDTLSAAYVPRREPRPANAAAATPRSRWT